MRYIKIRGCKKKISKIQGWINENLELDTEFLNERKYMYTKVYVDPWDSLTLTKSHIPEPKGKAKLEIIKGLEKIYDHWKTKLEKLNRPYYLKIWLYEPRISKSQVVCAIDDRINHYENIFEAGEFKKNNSSFLSQLSQEFKWEPKVDEEPYWKSDLLWSIEQYKKNEAYFWDRRLLEKLENGSFRNQEIQNSNGNKDIIYFIPKGKVWVGSK